MQQQVQTSNAVDVDVAFADNELDEILKRSFRPRTDEASSAVRRAISTLAAYANKGKVKVSRDVVLTIESLVAEIDEKLSEQMNHILHQKEFQKLESAWRGLSYLVNNTESNDTLKIRVLNISKDELAKTLRRYRGSAWDQSPIFKQIYEHEYGQFGGEPFGCMIGDYEFDHSPQSVALLTELAKISAAAHCPFIASASPTIMQMNSWQELGNPRDIGKIFTTPEYAPWRRLRESNDSRYLVLTLPRFLARLPYGAKSLPIDDFAFEEVVSPYATEDFTWANAAYAMGVNINRAFNEYGWCSRIRGIESGGSVEELPAYSFPSDEGGYELTCPTELAISDRRENELSNAGFLPLVYRKHSDFAAFIGSCTLHSPTSYDDPDATANAKLSARLPYIFATCRFAHYLKCIVRDKIGSFRSRDDMQVWLNDWLMNYVDGDPSISTEATKAKRPLAAAEVHVEDVEDDPGFYRAHFYLRPHYQLEGMTVSLRLVSKLPSSKESKEK
ncbi:type VI secretion system contractile sheath large subunit [Serratia sp. UGAL515B_01]|uniref:type VI secretion system contractile sheath large subunit n=1 Tax=Serratia sp. UGAL515B_01 TaxID=2986763 RepID=UPI002953BD46|nr:type VI secretion system contractile sheath large subunit [Serratia sp. UGAL515B_01]WON77454.1 type VI secretion system contractile sheath large subunit [Serratia sp. UGAL515B_01]